MAGYLAKSTVLCINGTDIPASELANQALVNFNSTEDYLITIAQFLQHWLDETPSISVQTSGSTGKPKMVTLLKDRMVSSAKRTNTFFHLNTASNALLALPAEYIAGKMMLVRALVGGYRLIVQPPTSNPLQMLSERIDFTPLVPLQAMASKDQLKQTKTLLLGGAPVSTSMQEELLNHAGTTAIFQSYGMTETLSHIALRNLSKRESFYTCLPDVSLALGEQGNLIIHAPGITDNPLETTDAVKLLSPHTFEWLGRLDYVINSGGVKIHPEKVEEKLAPFFEVPLFIHHQSDAILGNAVILIVEQDEPVDEKLQHVAFSSLNRLEKPKEIYSIPKFSRTVTGKIKREETVSLIKLT